MKSTKAKLTVVVSGVLWLAAMVYIWSRPAAT
jgi:hypothetical protein